MRAVSLPTSNRSSCILCAARVSVFTGRNVPGPTCSVTKQICTPRPRICSSNSGGEMQSRRRRGHRAADFGKDRLVPLPVLQQLVVAMNVGRQREFPRAVRAGRGCPACRKISTAGGLRHLFQRRQRRCRPDFPLGHAGQFARRRARAWPVVASPTSRLWRFLRAAGFQIGRRCGRSRRAAARG